jgi:hypothetical protein
MLEQYDCKPGTYDRLIIHLFSSTFLPPNSLSFIWNDYMSFMNMELQLTMMFILPQFKIQTKLLSVFSSIVDGKHMKEQCNAKG